MSHKFNQDKPPNRQTSAMSSAEPIRVLVFSRTVAYRHDSIPASIKALEDLAATSSTTAHPFVTTATEDPTIFTPSGLSQFRVIILLQCSGEFLDSSQLEALKGFVHSGGGVVGIHCASFGMESSEWYGRLIGGVFKNHPEPQMAKIRSVVNNMDHLLLAGLLKRLQDESEGKKRMFGVTTNKEWEWDWFDEYYNFKTNPWDNPHLQILLEVNEETYTGGTHGERHPLAWAQEFEGGRSFYNSLGHFDEAYLEDPGFMRFIYKAILWTARLDS
ncbi:ThuA-like domain-containing protein [Neurospora tetraspora]|uniref:ThuA-like domain-containing protein n=1 Tax=Neurospora tetraspora TaxID=94610 RepID=A0AAE0JJQ6_9PEZI|nr:ThuA-like domain-containing protein [Neurospora tetraspora]